MKGRTMGKGPAGRPPMPMAKKGTFGRLIKYIFDEERKKRKKV